MSDIGQHDNWEQNARCLLSHARRESKHPNPAGKPSKAITMWPKQTGVEAARCDGLSLPLGSGRG